MLRVGYYDALSGKAMIRHKHGSKHMVHCFDHIRQSIACAADESLEPVDPSFGGVRGWAVTHQCRNLEELDRWTEKMRTNDDYGIMNHLQGHNAEMANGR